MFSRRGDKIGIGSPLIRPRAALINPARFATLPALQISAGVVDMFSHILERYFSNTEHTEFVDGQAEAALRTILEFGPKVLSNPKDYDAWCQIGLAGSFAHNGYFGLGREEDWACHAIEHEISGWREEITHGWGLAVVIPAWMRYVAAIEPRRVADFSVRVMGVAPGDTKAETIRRGINALVEWTRRMALPTNLRELGAEDCPIESLARHCCRAGTVGKYVPLDQDAVLEILSACRGA